MKAKKRKVSYSAAKRRQQHSHLSSFRREAIILLSGLDGHIDLSLRMKGWGELNKGVSPLIITVASLLLKAYFGSKFQFNVS